MERDFKGIWIPKEIWLSEELTLIEKVFLVEIDSLDNENGCFATNKYFSDFFGISTRRVSTIINSLVDKGYIKSTIIYKEDSKEIEKRILNIISIGVWNKYSKGYGTNIPEGYGTNIPEGMEEKFQDNNTINNTNINNTNINKKNKKETEYDLIINSYTDNLDLKNTIYEFIKMRKTIKKPMTSNALSLILKKLDKLAHDDSTRIQILEQSIINSWQGIFELKGDSYGSFKQNTPTGEDKWSQYDFE